MAQKKNAPLDRGAVCKAIVRVSRLHAVFYQIADEDCLERRSEVSFLEATLGLAEALSSSPATFRTGAELRVQQRILWYVSHGCET